MSTHRPPGMTLIETLISVALLGLLGLILVQIYDVSRAAFSSSTGQIALQQKARVLMERIAPLLVHALPPDESIPAIISPAAGDASDTIVFSVPAPDFDPRHPTYSEERIRREADRSVVLDPNTPSTSDDRVLGRDIERLRFAVVARNVVRVTVDVYGTARGASSRDKLQRYTLDGLVQIPYYSKN